MTAVKKTQTGPLTDAGKKRSSMNARTHGLYSRTLLPFEDPNDFKSLVQSLHDEWSVRGPTADLLINDIALCYYRLSRLELAKSVKSNSLFSDHLNRRDFCTRLGLEFDEANKLPDWFFDTSQDTVKTCEQAKLLLDQCDHLRKNLSPDLVKNAHKELRQLWLYVMGNARPEKDASITKQICELMDTESESLAFGMLYKEIQKDYRYELLWISMHERIVDLIRALQASHSIFVITRPDWLKAESALQRQISTNMAQLMALKNLQDRSHPEVIQALPT
jgi:hypothetical protein